MPDTRSVTSTFSELILNAATASYQYDGLQAHASITAKAFW